VRRAGAEEQARVTVEIDGPGAGRVLRVHAAFAGDEGGGENGAAVGGDGEGGEGLPLRAGGDVGGLGAALREQGEIAAGGQPPEGRRGEAPGAAALDRRGEGE